MFPPIDRLQVEASRAKTGESDNDRGAENGRRVTRMIAEAAKPAASAGRSGETMEAT